MRLWPKERTYYWPLRPDRYDISQSLDVTQHIKPPRVLFLPFRMGHLFGVPFHNELQRKILLEMLEHLKHANSGEIRKFEMTWAEARKQGKEIERNR